MAAPQTGGVDPLNPQPQPAAQPWYTQNDANQFQGWAQSRYGRQATPQELQQIGSNSTDMASAQSYADTLAQQQGWAPSPTQTPTTPYTPGPGVAPPTAGTSTPPQGPADPNQSALQARIQQMLQTNTGDVNTGSQEYQSQLGSFKRGQGSALERAKNAAAERAAGSGTLSSGGFDASQQALDMQAAGQAGDFEAGLASQQIQRQRDDVAQALQLAQQNGLSGEARQLQERLANLDSNLRQQGMNLSGELGRSDLDLRRYLGRGQLGLGMLGTLLGNQRSQDALGFNYAQLGQQANQQALQALLGGL